MHYGRPSKASYPKSGKFYENFVELFGSEDVQIAQDGAGVEVAHSLLTQPDEILDSLDRLSPASELGEFLDNYEEARKIANNLIQLRNVYSRIDLDKIVADIVLHKFPDDRFSADQIWESFKSGTLRGDYPQLFDFTDFVEGAFELVHGEIVNSELLQQTNALLKEKCGPYYEIDQLPEVKGAESLAGKRIFIIDDQDIVISKLIPPLMVATGGAAEFIYHTDQSVDEIVGLIIGLQPEIILLDNKLSAGIMGQEVADRLIKSGYTGKIIGFSNNMEPPKGFLDNGAMGHVRKDTNSIITSILGVAKLISESNKNASS